uniref:Uncharacterized protein LOC104220459 n=1 Tax=Nicotiana sylvestris TaxID=4096 RepID=A0A1U7VTG3_NICSY|nr:PREDICTED: uncharacterized protein LOC104220459 [Nicotiana sylvestris]
MDEAEREYMSKVPYANVVTINLSDRVTPLPSRASRISDTDYMNQVF